MEQVVQKKQQVRAPFYEERDSKVPDLRGIPMYYAGYKDVLNQLKTSEEIIGQSDTRFIVISCLLKYLFRNLDDEKYIVGINKTGLHLGKNSNVSSGIFIYKLEVLKNHSTQDKYLDIPPLVVIEVDIQAATRDFGITQVDYYSMKTKRLLKFGAKEVFWFFSGETRQQLIAKPGQDWIISDWEKTITVLNQYRFSLADLLQKESLSV